MFGPKVIGEEEFARQQALSRATGGNIFGPKVTGIGLAPEPKRLETNPIARQSAANLLNKETPQVTGTLSAADLEKLLQENPTHFDTLYEVEMARNDGPRREALLVFKRIEMTTLSRPTIVAEIDAVLEAVAPPKKAELPKPAAKKAAAKKDETPPEGPGPDTAPTA